MLLVKRASDYIESLVTVFIRIIKQILYTVYCKKDLSIGHLKVNYFVDFIEKLWINNSNSNEIDNENEENEELLKKSPFNDVANFHQIRTNSYKSLNQIEMTASGVSRKQFIGVKTYLEKVQYIKVYPDSLSLKEGFFESFLKFCSNLKRLTIVLVSTNLIHYQNDWLLRNYPLLEHFELQMLNAHKIEAMETFLQLNPNIRTIAIYGRFLWMNRESFRIVGHKLNILATTYIENYLNSVELSVFCGLLNELHEQKLYKRLHLYFPGACFKQIHANELALVKGLAKLAVMNPHELVNLASLTDLEELFMGSSNFIADLKDLPAKLINLKRVQFLITSLNDILILIRGARKLNKLKFNLIRNESSDEFIDFLDLLMLNKEREKLSGASKIIIYVREKIYLATKWTIKCTNYTFIEMKRATSYDWRHEFDASFFFGIE